MSTFPPGVRRINKPPGRETRLLGDQPGIRSCVAVDGITNLILALPSGLVGPWLNARRAHELVAELVDPSGTEPPLPAGGVRVEVGSAVEDRADLVWMSWDDW